MTAQPIPGPYAVDPDDREGMEHNNHIVVADRPHLRIAFMAHGGPSRQDEFDATARLLAASWDMLVALRAVREFVEDEFRVRVDSCTLGGDLATVDPEDESLITEALDTLAVIDAALEKAEGK